MFFLLYFSHKKTPDFGGARKQKRGITVFAPCAVPLGPQYELFLSWVQINLPNRKVKVQKRFFLPKCWQKR